MNQQMFDAILSNVSGGSSQTRACHDALSTIAHMMAWLAAHPNGKVLQAALLQAEGDAQLTKANCLQAALSKRIDDNLIRTPQLAAVEQAEISRLRKEGQSLRVRSEKMMSSLSISSRSGSSWTDRM